jgi:6-pyruvoyltetrahydropterin/6-carboxytetrahydropterin synthase
MPSVERFSIHLHKENFKFSAAHFLIFPDGSKERLHGHNYRVAIEIEAPLDRDGLVVDFKQVKPVVRAICDELDEHWLVPGQHPELEVEAGDDGHTRVAYRGDRYMAPTAEVIVLPIGNTSVENFASWFAHEMKRRLEARFAEIEFRRLRVAIEETSGQHGVYEILQDDDAD